MKERILTGWDFQRTVFAVMGIFIIVQSILDEQWFGLFFGTYFASMGVFRFGCGAGNCYGGTYYKEAQNISSVKLPSEDILFEEIKNK